MRIERTYLNCPYSDLPENAFWKKSVAGIELIDINPMSQSAFNLTDKDIIASAGSCFAQHISRYLSSNKYKFLISEPPHPFVPPSLASEYNYGTYPARFGNIYTSRQLLQLIKRAYGTFSPSVEPYQVGEHFLDPFRPFIQPSGFVSKEELENDREKHLSAVRKMFEELNVFIFTLGLTECWEHIQDGAVFPTCPGCGAGEFDSKKYRFKNLTVEEVKNDLDEFLHLLREINPTAKVIFTVSPVPLIATYSGDHVLHATTYSKSVLRVAVQEIREAFDYVDYFPSYEIITTNANRGNYYHSDLRNVLEGGVSHVMRCFFKSYMDIDIGSDSNQNSSDNLNDYRNYNEINKALMDVICEEEYLEEVIEGS